MTCKVFLLEGGVYLVVPDVPWVTIRRAPFPQGEGVDSGMVAMHVGRGTAEFLEAAVEVERRYREGMLKHNVEMARRIDELNAEVERVVALSNKVADRNVELEGLLDKAKEIVDRALEHMKSDGAFFAKAGIPWGALKPRG